MVRGQSRDATRGQALPLVALVMWFVAGSMLVLVTLGAGVVRQARAQAAVDATALADAAAPGSGAVVALANGAAVARREQIGEGVQVEVVVAERRARARAVRELILDPGGWWQPQAARGGATHVGGACNQLPGDYPVDFDPCHMTPTR